MPSNYTKNSHSFVPVSLSARLADQKGPVTVKEVSSITDAINRLFQDIYTKLLSTTEFVKRFKRSGITYSDIGVVPVEQGGTGTDNLKDVYTEMHEMTVLEAYDDLNDFVVPGVYAATAATAATVVNAPESNAFSLYVTANSNGKRVVQLWARNSTATTWYIRYMTSSDTWSAWMSISDTATEAEEAVKLKTARTIRTNLGLTTSASFDGTQDVTPGVTGTLLLGNGGTGGTTAAEARANLGLGNTSGPVPVANGGTGASTALGALNNLFASAPTLNAITGYSGRATFDVGGFYQIGKLVIVQATLTVASTLGANANSMVGRDLPRPAAMVGISASLPDTKRTSAPVAATITTNGYLYLDRSGQLVSGDIIYLNGVYFAA